MVEELANLADVNMASIAKINKSVSVCYLVVYQACTSIIVPALFRMEGLGLGLCGFRRIPKQHDPGVGDLGRRHQFPNYITTICHDIRVGHGHIRQCETMPVRRHRGPHNRGLNPETPYSTCLMVRLCYT